MKTSMILEIMMGLVLLGFLCFSGCTLDTEGKQIICPPVFFEADVTPIEHQYEASGFCMVEKTVVAYTLNASWKKGATPSANKSVAEFEITYYGKKYKGWVTVKCPDGDPFLYDVRCHDRKIAGSITTSPIWPFYEHFFGTIGIPVIFDDVRKKELRKEDNWPATPPTFLFPDPVKKSAFKNPDIIPIALELPFKKGYVHKWYIHVSWERIDKYGHWVPDGSQKITMREQGSRYIGSTTLSLKPGKYRIRGRSYYTELWKSDPSTPVEFLVLMKKRAKKIIYQKSQQIRDFFRINENISLEFTHPPAQNILFLFQKYLDGRWKKFSKVIIVKKKTSNMGNTAITKLTFKIQIAGKYRVRGGTGKWQRFEVK